MSIEGDAFRRKKIKEMEEKIRRGEPLDLIEMKAVKFWARIYEQQR